tara:strand:- start:592 stop:804 length:213 start_codon:yes stop_codon:yes gene_type:complete
MFKIEPDGVSELQNQFINKFIISTHISATTKKPLEIISKALMVKIKYELVIALFRPPKITISQPFSIEIP